ncbi:cyclase family protein [Georgenia thermotolerans]|uniref:Cyclase family protein n=1 Tax=Georgenia thermotolerans TaxID=527326 RepID=A0A7J5UUE2_9MICO|nr:cyclase family protein [Georgenia thermotolerans]KAE8765897.1 cyclase family protein [Georgenia thermotolerans]
MSSRTLDDVPTAAPNQGSARQLPAYRDLPALGALDIRHSWGLLPPEEGTLSFAGPAEVAAAAGLVTTGETIPLNLPVDAFDPPLFGRKQLDHQVLQTGRNECEDVLSTFNPQASSQLDGLAHVRAREFGYYGGETDLAAARSRLGMHHWARRGISGRGVLLDVERFHRETGRPSEPFEGAGYEPEELQATAEHQEVRLRPGDIVLVRTGWVGRYLALDPEQRTAHTGWNGLAAHAGMAELVWDGRFALVGSDNPAVENGPGDPRLGSLHRRLLPALGVPLMELLELDRLAERCAGLGRWEFFFVSVPLHVQGAVSSTANAMAIL